MEGLTVNDASVTPHDGGSSWTVDSLGIGEPLDQYSLTYFVTEIKSKTLRSCTLLYAF